jgi:two-component system nitrogen regulation response regulator GlnG
VAQVRTQSLGDLDRIIEDRLQAGTQHLYAEWQALTERRLLAQVLRHAGGNLSLAAKILGIHRATLRSKLAAHGVTGEGDAATVAE